MGSLRRPRQRGVQLGGEDVGGQQGRFRVRAHHDVQANGVEASGVEASRQAGQPRVQQMPQPPAYPVSYDGRPHGPRNHEPDADSGRTARRDVDGHRARSRAGTGSDSGSELGGPPHTRGRRKHEGPCPENGQADSRSRPLRRRAAMIARPARVRIRRRNPCVLARRRLFGWNVRLLTAKLHQKEGKARWRRLHTGGRSSLRSPAQPVKLARAWGRRAPSRRHAGR